MVDKMKTWVENGDKESIREYNRWKAKNWRIKNKIVINKIESEEEKKIKDKQRQYYLENRECILKKWHDKQKHIWVDVNLEDRDFVLNFNPNHYPKYIEARNELMLRLKKKNIC